MSVSVRDEVLRFVLRYPGVHAREIERRLSLPSKLASYHLDALESEGLVRRVTEEGFTRFLPRSLARRNEADFVCLMRRTVAMRITLLLLDSGEIAQGEIARRLKLAKASVAYHLRPLVETGVVRGERAGRTTLYSVLKPDDVRRRLRGFEPLPGELGVFAKMWDDVLR